MTFHLPQLDYRSALDILQAATDSFVVPISSRVIMVAHDTPAKRNDLEQYITLSVPVPTVITAQELTEIVQVVRQVSSADMKIGWDNEDSMIVLRDRASRAALAQALLGQLIAYHPQVMIDVELLQVADTVIRNYGFTVTNNFPLAYLGSIQNSIASIPSSVTNLLTFGAGHTLIGIGAAEVQSLFNETSSESRALYAARMRCRAADKRIRLPCGREISDHHVGIRGGVEHEYQRVDHAECGGATGDQLRGSGARDQGDASCAWRGICQHDD